MGAFPVLDENAIPIKELLSEVPTSLRGIMTRGLKSMAALPPDIRLSLAKEIGDSAATASDTDIEKFAEKMRLDEETASSIFTAASFLVALATSRSETSEYIVQELIEAKLLSGAAKDAASEVLKYLEPSRLQLKTSMRLEALSNQTLPAFRSLDTSVDLRLDIRSGVVDLVAPAVVAHLRTDHNSTNLFFQMTKLDVERLAEKLASLLKQIAVAENWVKGKTT